MEVTIEKLDHQGRGITHIDGKITFVENALPEEIVEIKLTKSDKKINEAVITKFIKKSSKRIESKCPYYKECGGCNLLHLSYENQLEYKENKIKEIMSRYADLPTDKINHIERSPKDFYYRNKVTLKSNGKLGYYKKKTNDIVNIDKCLLVNNKLNEMIYSLNKIGIDKEYDEVMLRSINETESSLTLNLRNSVKTNPAISKYEKIANSFSVYSQNRIIKTNTNSNIIGRLNNKEFKISPTAFFQVNTEQTINLYNKVLSYVKELNNPRVLDLYCGTGTIGIYISDYASKVLGVEINAKAIEDANKNKKMNDIKNIEFIAGDTKTVLRNNNYKADIVIVDPPRAGLDKEVIEDLIKINSEKIIYVSCDPITLARDIKLLSSNYEVLEVTPFDMFPNTYHVECVSVLSRKDK